MINRNTTKKKKKKITGFHKECGQPNSPQIIKKIKNKS